MFSRKANRIDYVYYARLKTDAERSTNKQHKDLLNNLYNSALNALNFGIFLKGHDYAQDILNMAQIEAAKEAMLLKEIFGRSVPFNLEDPNTVRQLLDAVNINLGDPVLYETALDRIFDKDKADKRMDYQYFSNYINQVMQALQPQLANEVTMALNKSINSGETIVDVCLKVLESHKHEILMNAFQKLSEADTGDEQKVYKDLYEKMLSLEHTIEGNKILDWLGDVWKIDDMFKLIAEQTATSTGKVGKSRSSRSLFSQQDKFTARGFTDKDTEWHVTNNYTTGSMAEIVRSIADSVIANNLKGKNFKADVNLRVGEFGAKADQMVTFNLPINSNIVDKLNSDLSGSTNYKKNRNAFRNFYNAVSKLQGAFVVLTNTKNYFNPEKDGFGAGTAMNLDTFRGLYSGKIPDIDNLLFNIMQMGEGAVGQDRMGGGLTEDIRKKIALSFAYFLFDDYDAIGEIKFLGNGNIIHLFNLNNVLVPLSLLLYAVGKTIGNIMQENTILTYVSPTISVPSTHADDDAFSFGGIPAWQQQRQETWKDTKISLTFLKHFQDFLGQMIGR